MLVKRLAIGLALFGLMIVLPFSTVVRADSAQQVFNQYQSALLEVQVVEKQTQHKSAFGSGFYVSSDLIITNYHVIANRVSAPDSYQLMAKQGEAPLQALDILALDVVNDLALLKTAQPTPRHFILAETLPEQGATVFSLGNPHDLGMVVVPGTYNGLKQQSFYPRLHVTGSINPGMSGGPSVDESGAVVGVNVATGGNQLGFVVPVAQVKSLLAQQPATLPSETELKQQIGEQLQQNQQQMLAPILASAWQMKPLGRGVIPERVAPFIVCWGRTTTQIVPNDIRTTSAFCGQQEEVYLSDRFSTGKIQMHFEWLDGSDLPLLKFNRHYQNRLLYARADNRVSLQDVDEFNCQSDLVALNQRATRVVYCVRAYKDYPELFDAIYVAATLPSSQTGFISRFTLAGVSKDNADAFTRKFMETVVWQ